MAAGAHLVVDSIAALPAVIAEIEVRLARGERP
jgi:phosphonoacetaldehyde hydrolase